MLAPTHYPPGTPVLITPTVCDARYGVVRDVKAGRLYVVASGNLRFVVTDSQIAPLHPALRRWAEAGMEPEPPQPPAAA